MTWSCASEVCAPAWNLVHAATASIYDRSSGNTPSHDRSKVLAAGCTTNTKSLQGMGPPEPLHMSWQVAWDLELLPVMTTDFGNVTPYSLAHMYKCFIELWCLHLLCGSMKTLHSWKQYILWNISTHPQSTWHYIPQVNCDKGWCIQHRNFKHNHRTKNRMIWIWWYIFHALFLQLQ